MFKKDDTITIKLEECDAVILNGELQSFRVGRYQIIAHTSYKAFVYKINDGDFSAKEYESTTQAEYAAEEEIEKYEIERAEVSIYMCVKAYETGHTTEPSDYEQHSIMDKRSLGVK